MHDDDTTTEQLEDEVSSVEIEETMDLESEAETTEEDEEDDDSTAAPQSATAEIAGTAARVQAGPMRTVMLVFGLAFGACAVALFCALQMGALGGKGGGSRRAVQPSRQRQRKGAMRVAADDYDEEYGDSEDEEEDEEAEDVEFDDILGDDDDEFDRALVELAVRAAGAPAIVPRRPPSDVVNTGDEQPVGRGAAEEEKKKKKSSRAN